MILTGIDAVVLLIGPPTGLTALFSNLTLAFLSATVIAHFAPLQSEITPIKGSLFVDCSMMSMLPPALPQDGRLFIITVSPEEIAKNRNAFVFSERVGKPGEEIKWQTQAFPLPTGSRCEIINDTADPLLDVIVPIAITFTKNKEREESKAIRSIVLNRLDPGAQNKFVLFFRGEPGRLTSLQIPTEASARLSNENKRRSVKVAQATNLLGPLVVLYPFSPLPDQPAKPPPDATSTPK
jgi:hypothetical protein